MADILKAKKCIFFIFILFSGLALFNCWILHENFNSMHCIVWFISAITIRSNQHFLRCPKNNYFKAVGHLTLDSLSMTNDVNWIVQSRLIFFKLRFCCQKCNFNFNDIHNNQMPLNHFREPGKNTTIYQKKWSK
jgi:hypothetical protein